MNDYKKLFYVTECDRLFLNEYKINETDKWVEDIFHYCKQCQIPLTQFFIKRAMGNSLKIKTRDKNGYFLIIPSEN